MKMGRQIGLGAMGLILVAIAGLGLVGCGGPPKSLKQPLPATEQDARADIEGLLRFACVGTADPVAGVTWLTWREQVHTPELGWVKRRMRLDWPVEIGFRSAGRMGWRVDVSLLHSQGIDPNLTVPEGGESSDVETLTKASFTLPTPTDAGKLRSAWLRITGGPVVPNLE